MARRKARRGEVVCTCGAYPFPHRQMGGRCNGAFIVRQTWDCQRECMQCHLREERDGDYGIEYHCQALEGREELTECPALDEHIRFNEIPLYGVNRR